MVGNTTDSAADVSAIVQPAGTRDRLPKKWLSPGTVTITPRTIRDPTTPAAATGSRPASCSV
ncbi:hypothetical protein ABT314_30380 [Streptomyces spiralis]